MRARLLPPCPAAPDAGRWLDNATWPGIAALRAAAAGVPYTAGEITEALVVALAALCKMEPQAGQPAVAALQHAAMSAYLEATSAAPAPGPLSTLAAVKQALQAHAGPASARAAGAMPAAQAARHRAALLPLALLVCDRPRTAAQRQLALARLRGAGAAPIAARGGEERTP